MIVDKILDRKDGCGYCVDDLKYMYDEAMLFGHIELARAIDGGTNADIQRELCAYIDNENYNPAIKEYILKCDWLAGID